MLAQIIQSLSSHLLRFGFFVYLSIQTPHSLYDLQLLAGLLTLRVVVLEVRDSLALAVCRGLSLRAGRNQRIHRSSDLFLDDVLKLFPPFGSLQGLFNIRLHSLRNFILYLSLQNGLILFRHVSHILLRN